MPSEGNAIRLSVLGLSCWVKPKSPESSAPERRPSALESSSESCPCFTRGSPEKPLAQNRGQCHLDSHPVQGSLPRRFVLRPGVLHVVLGLQGQPPRSCGAEAAGEALARLARAQHPAPRGAGQPSRAPALAEQRASSGDGLRRQGGRRVLKSAGPLQSSKEESQVGLTQ